mgnify:CR=1 FL=1
MWKTYSVKTIYRSTVSGKPFAIDDEYSSKFDLIEERVVTVKARSFDEAIRRAESEAEEYTEESHTNPYGQEVVQEYLGYANVFEPFKSAPANVEVYSNQFLVRKELPDEELADNLFGNDEIGENQSRKVFLNSEFSGFVVN